MRSTFMNTTEQARADRKWYVIDAYTTIVDLLVLVKPPTH